MLLQNYLLIHPHFIGLHDEVIYELTESFDINIRNIDLLGVHLIILPQLSMPELKEMPDDWSHDRHILPLT